MIDLGRLPHEPRRMLPTWDGCDFRDLDTHLLWRALIRRACGRYWRLCVWDAHHHFQATPYPPEAPREWMGDCNEGEG